MSLFISVVIIFEIIHVYSGQVRVREKNETHNILLGGDGCGCWFSFVCLMLKLEKVAQSHGGVVSLIPGCTCFIPPLAQYVKKLAPPEKSPVSEEVLEEKQTKC